MLNIKLEAMGDKIEKILKFHEVDYKLLDSCTKELLDLYNVIDPVCINCGKGKSTHSKEYSICSDRYAHFKGK